MTDAPDSDALHAEVERLRAENEALQRRGMTRDRLRRASAILLLVLGCGLAVLSLLAIWLRVTMLDTDRYVETVAPIAAQPAVQKAVADKLNTAINSKIDFDTLFREALPDRADVFAPALERGLQTFINTRLNEFTQSPRFQNLWTEANRRAHTRVVELLTGGRSKRLVLDDDTVYLDLSPAVDRVRTGLQERGLTRLAAAIPASVDGRIQLIQSDALVSAQRGVRLLKAVAIVLPLLALLCLAGSIYLTRPWRRGLLRAGIGVAIAMLLLIAALGVARSAYLDALGQGALPHDAAAGIFDQLVGLLRHGVRVVVAVAVLLALVSFFAGLPLRRYASGGWSRLATDSRRSWVGRQRNPLMLITGGLGGIVLLASDAPTGGTVLTVLIVVGLVIAAIAGFGSQAGDPVADELGADHQQEHGPDGGVVSPHP